MTILYRLIEKKDAPGIFKVDQDCFHHHWSQESYEKEVKNFLAHYIVAEAQEEIIGFAGFWSVIDEAHVTNVGVLKKYRRQGVGQALVNRLMQLAEDKACTAMTLEVRSTNLAALALYKNNGFIKAGMRENYYESGVDAIIMWRYDLGQKIET